MEGCDAHVPWTLFLAGGGAEVSDVPQSLLEALDRTSRSLSERPLVSVMDVLEQWFASHHVIVLDECGPQCPAFEVAQPMAGIPARCFARYYLPGPDEAPIGKPCPVMTARAAREAANDTRGGVMSNKGGARCRFPPHPRGDGLAAGRAGAAALPRRGRERRPVRLELPALRLTAHGRHHRRSGSVLRL